LSFRQLLLQKTKHFSCRCARCADPTEFGTGLASLACRECEVGEVLPADPVDLGTDWVCADCGREVLSSKVGVTSTEPS
jgi:hypothetical protein